MSSTVYWHGFRGFETEVSGTFFELASSARVTLDIGAHIGVYAIAAALANGAGRVYAFEPLPAAYSRLMENVALNGLKNLECRSLALGSDSGKKDFFHVPLNAGLPSSSSLSREFMASHFSAVGILREVVEVTTVDRFLSENGVEGIDLVKIDTESTELDVLEGMRATLERDRPVIICEVLPSARVHGLMKLLGPLGYSYGLMTDSGIHAMDQIIPDPNWRNYAFIPIGRSCLGGRGAI